MNTTHATELGGCYTCRFALTEAQVADALRQLLATGREAILCQPFLAIEFADGFDALFVPIIPNEQASRADGIASVTAEFDRLDSRRCLVLNGLRRHAVASGVSVKEKATGHWDIQFDGGTSGIHVGPVITRLVAQHDAAGALVKVVENNWLPKLTAEQATQLIQTTAPVPGPVSWKSDEQVVGLFGPGAMALDCKALDGAGELPREPQALLETLAPKRNAPGQLVLNRLVDRLGRWRFSIQLMGRGGAQLEFTDKLDHCRVHPRSKKLAREIEREGIEVTVDRLAAEFTRLDKARQRALGLLATLMIRHGFFADEEGDSVWFGKTHRLAKFDHGRSLTLALSRQSPEHVVHSWLTKNELLPAIPSEAELKGAIVTGIVEPPKRWLPGEPPVAWDRLPKLAEFDHEALDHCASECITAALHQAQAEPGASRIGDLHDLLSLWAKPFWYRPGDGWASEQFWWEFAEKAWLGARRQLAAVLLVRAGHAPADLDEVGLFRQLECWSSEAFEDEFVWQFVDRLPWVIDEGDYPKCPNRFRPRPPQIVRRAVRAFREAFAEYNRADTNCDRWSWLSRALTSVADVDRESAKVWLRSAELDELEAHLQKWASEADFVGNDWDAAFVVAAEFGWQWLPEVLSNNPLFIPAQFYMENVYSAPGEVALKLSWVAPSALAGRFAAYALREQSPETLEQRARSIAGGSECYDSGRDIVRNWLTVDRFAAAIAWQRCRTAGVC